MAISKISARKLREIFIDEMCTIYLRDMNVVSVDENGQEMKITAMAQGYVLDVDQDFFYLGTPDGEITRTISHDIAQMVEIEFVGSEFMDSDMIGPEEDVH